MLNLLDNTLCLQSCNVFTEPQFECGVISSSVFTVLRLKTRQTWECACICWSGFNQ